MNSVLIVPKLVERALEGARQHGFSNSCFDEVGQLLRIVSGFQSKTTIAEIGTGYGVGASWLISGMSDDSQLYTVEFKPDRAQFATELFAACANVHVLAGDWKQILQFAPFDFVFCGREASKI